MGKNSYVDCRHCETQIRQPRKGQLFCTDRCRVAYHREQNAPVGAVVMSFADWLSKLQTTTQKKPITRAEFARQIGQQIHAMAAWDSRSGLYQTLTKDPASRVQ